MAKAEKIKLPKRIKITEIPTADLFNSPKITPSIYKELVSRIDFSAPCSDFCNKMCQMPEVMKNPQSFCQIQSSGHFDVVIIQEQRAADTKWRSGAEIEKMHRRQMGFMLRKALPEGATFTVLELAKCPKKPYFVNGKPKKVTMTNLKACSNYLFAELEHIKPSVIISTSTNITKVLGIKGKANYDNRGEFYLTNLPNLQVQVPTILTLHVEVLNMIRQNASGKMYGPDFYSVILNDFVKAGKILTGALRIQDLRERVERVRRYNTIVPINIEEVERWVDTLMAIPNEHVISWDLETTSLDPWSADARILTCQFGYRRGDGEVQTVVFALWHRENDYYDPDVAWEMIKRILLKPVRKVGHNVKFDTVFCAVTTGVRPAGIDFDTMLMLHSMNSGIQGNYGLKAAVWDYLPDIGLGGYEELLDETLDPEVMKRLIALEKAEFKEYSDEDVDIHEEPDNDEAE